MLIIEESASKRLFVNDSPRPGPYPFEGQCYGAIHEEGYSHGYRCTRPEYHDGDCTNGVGQYATSWNESTPGALSPSRERRESERRLKRKYGKFHPPKRQTLSQRRYYLRLSLRRLFKS